MKAPAPASTRETNRPAATGSAGARHASGESAYVDNSPAGIAQRKLADAIHTNPRMAAQRRRLRGMFGGIAQLKGGPEEEELLQGKFAPVQRLGPDEADVMGAQTLVPAAQRTSIGGLAGGTRAADPADVSSRPKVVQRVLVDGTEVNQDTNMPTWDWTDGQRYHVNLTTDTSHISREGSPMIHYFFEGTGTDIVDKQPSKEERGGRSKKKVKGVKGKVKTKTVFSALPKDLQEFIKDNWDEILGD